jgi:magnesium transporter
LSSTVLHGPRRPGPPAVAAIERLVRERDASTLAAQLAHYDAADIAELISALDDDAALACFLAVGGRRRVKAFEHLAHEQREHLVDELPRSALIDVLDEMSSDDRAEFFRNLGKPRRQLLLPLLAQAERNDVVRLMSFMEGTAGAIMSTEYAALPPDLGVDEALDELRRIAPKRETVYTIYVVDRNRVLLGVASLLDLITAPPGSRVRDVMKPDVLLLPAEADQEVVARTIAKYDLMALPIVDAELRLLGIVTHDDAIDVLEREQSEDVQLASGIDPEPSSTPYSRASARLLFRKRVLWLLALLVAALLSASVVAAFEQTLTQAVALAFFIPIVAGSGGNTGTQSAALIIRALATHDVSSRDWLRVFGKELVVGSLLGACMALAVLAISLLWPGARHLAPIVGVTMGVLVIWANLVGALLPLFLRGVGADPAVAGAPLVTTLVDATGLLIYFGLATLILSP